MRNKIKPWHIEASFYFFTALILLGMAGFVLNKWEEQDKAIMRMMEQRQQQLLEGGS